MALPRFLLPSFFVAICLAGTSGCGTTRLTDTARSASEEMLLSHAIDQSVGRLNLEVLAGQTVYLDTTNLGSVTFSGYLAGALRQHLLASGARLVSERDQAAVVVEARAGAVATTRHDSLLGIPQTTVPAILFGAPAALPEMAIIKRTIHIGVAKVGVFAYRTDNGAGLWQSGMEENQSVSQSNWYLGVGPFQTGDVILDGGRGRLEPPNSSHQRPRHHSPLEWEIWVGEFPPPAPWIPVEEPAESEEKTPAAPEPIDPGLPSPRPQRDDSWQWISPAPQDPHADGATSF